MVGKEILGYRVDEAIGAGSFGTVYKISKTNASGTYVRALKHIKIPATKQQYYSVLNSMGGDYSKADDYFAAALRETVDEIRILSMLSESGVRNIVQYYENDIIETSHPKTYDIYMMMEYLTPFTRVIEKRPMRVGEVICVGKDILKALISCHQKGIIHRDIKDDNIFVTADGVYKLGDFGVSKKLRDKSRAASMRGTPDFIAPEVYLGKESYDCTVDLYSLGIVLYRLLNKLRGPFLPAYPESYSSDDEAAAFEARMSGRIPELPLMAQNSLGEAVRKAIMPRAQRYNSAQEFLDALEKAESELSRDAWSTPAYEVFFEEEETDPSKQAGNTSFSDGKGTIGGLRFDTEEGNSSRARNNLFETIGSNQSNLNLGREHSNDSAQNDSAQEKKTKVPDTETGKNRRILRAALVAACAAVAILALVLIISGLQPGKEPETMPQTQTTHGPTQSEVSDTQSIPEDTEPAGTTAPTEGEPAAVVWQINHTDIEIQVGENFRLKLENDAGDVADAVWCADRSGIVRIAGDKITGIAKGDVTLSAAVDGNVYSCIVRVEAAPPATKPPTEETKPAEKPTQPPAEPPAEKPTEPPETQPPETQPPETEATEPVESQGRAPASYSIRLSDSSVYPGVTFYVTVDPDVSDYTQIVIHAIDPKGEEWVFVISSGNSMSLVVTEMDLTGTWKLYADVYNEYGMLDGASSGARAYLEVLPLF